MKKILSIFLFLVLALSLFACGGGNGGDDEKCDECVDTDNSGTCDVCGEAMPEEPISDIALIEDGVPNFNIIYAESATSDIRKAITQNIVSKLKNSHKIEVSAVMEGSQNDNPQDIEILIGDVTSRGAKYTIDRYELGKKGYTFKIVGSKILINAGSDEQLVEAIIEFAEDILKIGTDEAEFATMLTTDVVYKVQDNYKIKSVTVGGTDMKGYTIATDTENEQYMAAALELQDALYDKTGYYLKIVNTSEATDKSVIIKHIDKVSGIDSYSIKVEGTKLIISCAYDNMLVKATSEFTARQIKLTGATAINFTDTVFNQDISVLYYEDFGAKGDGVTDDFQAFYETHKMANQGGQKVMGTAGAEYYLHVSNFRAEGESGTKTHTITIKTDVDWNGATIIIDDRKMHNYSGGKASVGATKEYYTMAHTAVFSIKPNEGMTEVTFRDAEVLSKIVSDGLNPYTTHIDFKLDGWDGDLMIIPYNTNHGVYRRRGYGQFNGDSMHEVIVIDKDGNVSSETPIMFDYQNVDYMLVYKLDESTAISVGNGKVITRDSQIDHTVTEGKFQGGYVPRGLNVNRSYTTVYNIEHVVTDGFTINQRAYEGLEGPSANGFFVASKANHVTFKNCIMPGRMKYSNSSSYNFSASMVNYIVLDGCVQSNFWVIIDEDDDNKIINSTEYKEGAINSMASVTVNGKTIGLYWGLGGTNYCKNMQYLNSKISRFDAHQGLYHGKIINTEINDMELIGVGELIIEDVQWYSYSKTTPLLFMRSDYGYTWDGEIKLKDVKAYIHSGQKLVVANHSFVNWYFGYTCAIPSMSIDNLDVYYLNTFQPVDPGYTMTLVNITNSKMHLHGVDVGVTSYIPYKDADKDGFVDEPLFDINRDGIINDEDDVDLDNNGDKFNTDIKYMTEEEYTADGSSEKDYQRGVLFSGCTTNVNLTKPPKYVKIINNDGVNGTGGYVFEVKDTSGVGISDGLWYNTVDSMGGFFGGTTFIYGTGENDYFIGTNDKNGITNTFKFKK